MRSAHPVLVGGRWRDSNGDEWFETQDPTTGDVLERFPTSPWSEIDQALDAGWAAFQELQQVSPERIAEFLERYADLIEGDTDVLAVCAEMETGLPSSPRLDVVEIPRTVRQLRLAAESAKSRSWAEPTLSPADRIASWMAPIPGVVCVFGPNNFPFAFNGVSGGDFASAIATRHPVVAKSNPGHPDTTRLMAALAARAIEAVGLPAATVQLLYRTSHDDGRRLVADRRVAATAYTGSRSAGLDLKAHADAAGRPIYLEMSSVNPVVLLEGALQERGDELVSELAGSLLLGSGQFCTSPGLLFLIDSATARGFVEALAAELTAKPSETLLGTRVAEQLSWSYDQWTSAGAKPVQTGERGSSYASFPNTILEVSGKAFLSRKDDLQSEAFGNMSLVVFAEDLDELLDCIKELEGNLTGTVYSATTDSDDHLYAAIEPRLRQKVGRLLNNKAPTGVAVVPAMNHGGPYPATGHPGFTAVGMPASLRRFGMLQCYDNVPDHRLPPELQATNPLRLQRRVGQSITDREVQWGEPLAP